jgi:hemerythrin-like domain-containing protein
MTPSTRRLFLSSSAALGAVAFLDACKSKSEVSADTLTASSAEKAPAPPGADDKKDEDKKNASEEVMAVEDLMREHGVLRRAIIVYRESAARLRASPASVPPDALRKTAKLFRAFGEQYHESKLEEPFIFPAVRRGGGPAGALPDVLTAQHARGREITDYILAVTGGAKIGASATALAAVLEGFARMYESHTAIEDTVVFPAWKRTMTLKQYDELGDKFEDIEHETFGKDGFDDAALQMAAVEGELGLTDLAKLTAPAPPKI